MYQITPEKEVPIVTYATRPLLSFESLKIRPEHQEAGLFEYEKIHQLNMPAGYKKSIELYFK